MDTIPKVVGCQHNANRYIIYPDQKDTFTKGGKTFKPGQYLILFCPQGCDDVLVGLGENESEEC